MTKGVLAEALAAILALPLANYVFNHLIVRRSRYVYVIVVVLVCGIVVPAFGLHTLLEAGIVTVSSLKPAPLPIALGAMAGLASFALLLRGAVVAARHRIPRLFVGLIAPSLAEVVVFLGILFPLLSRLFAPFAPDGIARALIVVVAAASFALYHLTHAGPWRSRRILVTLFVVWLFLGAFYALVQNLWAAMLLNTALATVGFVRNGATGPDDVPLGANALFAATGIASLAWICSLS